MSAFLTAIESYPGKQAGLAEALGVTQGAISHWVTGRARPKPEMLPKLSELTGVPVGVLFEAIFGDAHAQGRAV